MSVSSLPTSDLRSQAKDYQRDRNHNAKWSRGAAPAQGKSCPHVESFTPTACVDCAKRPQPRSRHFHEVKQNWNKKSAAQKSTLARKVFRIEVVDASDGPVANVNSDSSGEDEVYDASTAPVPDAEVMYSFDAACGPDRGSGILSQAINKAVQRYENKETEKLVKEYDFVDDGKDIGEGYTADADEDDFEVIEYSHLK